MRPLSYRAAVATAASSTAATETAARTHDIVQILQQQPKQQQQPGHSPLFLECDKSWHCSNVNGVARLLMSY